MSAVCAGVDLGGTKIAAALVDADHRVLSRVRVPTPVEGPAEVVAAIAAAVAELGEAPLAIGVGAPGPISGGVVATAPNLVGWDDPVPLESLLHKALGVPVAVGNDATLGTYGEWVAGAGRGSADLLGVWLGTGVGGGLVLDGRPHEGAHGGAGEFGHMVVRVGGRPCGCGRRGCVEAYAGRANLEDQLDEALADGRKSLLDKLRRRKGRLGSGAWARALEAGDPLAVELIDAAVVALGAGVAAAVNLLDCDRVVFGGGLTEKLGQPFVDRIALAAEPGILLDTVTRTYVEAQLGDDAGAVGAAALARARLVPR